MRQASPTGIITALLLLGFTVPVEAQTEPIVVTLQGEIKVEPAMGSLLGRTAGLDVQRIRVSDALALLATTANTAIAFSPNSLPESLRVDCDCRDITLAEALDQILSETVFGYRELGDQVVIAKRSQRGTTGPVRHLPRGSNFASLAHWSTIQSIPPIEWLQETGVVAGQVTEAGTGRPLAGVQVTIEGTRRGTLTNDDGRYILPGVPAGTYTIRAGRIGFREEQRSVTVQTGATVSVDFTLLEAALPLDELVVTVTGEQRRREIGNVIGRITAGDSLAATAPINTLSDLLTARVAGLQVTGITGLTGTSPVIRIRGVNSISLANDPIFIVDGVRVEGGQTVSLGYGQSGGRLNDISPSDIESVEVVKGPAAATLYGTDAANGVIVITTKRGRTGPPQWTVFAEVGALRPAERFLDGYHSWGTSPQGTVMKCGLLESAAGACAIDSLSVYNPFYDDAVSPIGTGFRNQIGAQVRGGVDRFTYFFAAERERESSYLRLPQGEQDRLMAERGTSSVPTEQIRPNWAERISLRSNTSIAFDNAELALSSGFVVGDRQLPNPASIISPGEWGPGYKDPIDGGWRNSARPGETFSVRNTERFTRFLGSLRGNWRAADWLTTRAVVGVDVTGSNLDALQRFGEGPLGANRSGRRQNLRSTTFLYSADLGGSASFQLSPEVTSRTSVGVQYNARTSQLTSVTGTSLPPGSESILGAATIVGNEFDNQTIVAGAYVEESLGFQDRLFFSGAVRMDGSSSFGQDFRAAMYPKVSASWMAAERGPEAVLNSVRLRGAYGASGIQPGATDALTVYQIFTTQVDGMNVPAARPGSLGNSDLRPERQREFETGVDATLYGGRINVEATYYNRLSKDALLAQALPPDVGSALRWLNIGSVRNSGFEGLVSVQAIEGRTLSWDLVLSGSFNRNKLEKMGLDVEALGVTNFRHVEGYPLYGRWHIPVLDYHDANQNGIIEPNEVTYGEELVYLGQNVPPRQLSLMTGFNLWNNRVRVSSLFERRSGHTVLNISEVNRSAPLISNSRAANDPSASLWDQARLVAFRERGSWWGYVEDGSFTRWRELSLSLNIPEGLLTRINAGSAVLSLTARNLALFTNYTGKDPEVDSNPALALDSGPLAGLRFAEGYADNSTVPQTRHFILRLTLGF